MEKIPLSRRVIRRTAIIVGFAILVLLLYSLDRSAWVFTLYETGRDYAELRGSITAAIVECVIVALIAGEALAEALPASYRRRISPWLGIGLSITLLVQMAANLLGGYLWGTASMLALLGPERNEPIWNLPGVGTGPRPVFAISASVWLFTNLLIPVLILVLSKIQAQLVRLLIQNNLIEDVVRPRRTWKMPQWSWPNLHWPKMPKWKFRTVRSIDSAPAIPIVIPTITPMEAPPMETSPIISDNGNLAQANSVQADIEILENLLEETALPEDQEKHEKTTVQVNKRSFRTYTAILEAVEIDSRLPTGVLMEHTGLTDRGAQKARDRLVELGVLVQKDGIYVKNGTELEVEA